MWQFFLIMAGMELMGPLREWITGQIKSHYGGDLDLNRLQIAAQAVDQMNQRWAEAHIVSKEKGRAKTARSAGAIQRELARLEASLAEPSTFRALFQASGRPGSLLMEGAPVPDMLAGPAQAGAEQELAQNAAALGVHPDEVHQAMSGIQPSVQDLLIGMPRPEDPMTANWLARQNVPLR